MAPLRRLTQSFLAALALSVTMALGNPVDAGAQEENPVRPLTSLTIANGSEKVVLSIETVRGPEDTAKGLMHRKELGADRGMLFDFEEERPVSFWMRNTLIPLDMVFAKADGTVVKIHVNARPGDETEIPSEQPVRYVLEIEGGNAARLGIKVGSRLEVDTAVDPTNRI